MDIRQFEFVARALTSTPSRRHVLYGLGGLGVALGALSLSADADAKKKKKGKKKKGKKPTPPPPPPPTSPPPPPLPTPNAYGCFSVDVACTSAAECCTGICDGGLCRAHDTSTCNQEQAGLCLAGNPVLALCGSPAICACVETTGGSKFCGSVDVRACTECRTDADCLALGLPAGTACAPFSEGLCAGQCESGMTCIAPCGTKLDDL